MTPARTLIYTAVFVLGLGLEIAGRDGWMTFLLVIVSLEAVIRVVGPAYMDANQRWLDQQLARAEARDRERNTW